jgi:hypothetical protein
MKSVAAVTVGAAIPGTATAQGSKPIPDRQTALDHVVVLMFENRTAAFSRWLDIDNLSS